MASSKVFWDFLLLLLPLSLALLSVAVNGQQQGFLSIDCGKPAGYNYTDTITGLLYVSDSGYVDAGESHKINSSYTSSTQFSHSLDLRSFPNVTRGCYTVPVIAGSRHVLRAWFQYGNYDGKDRLPEFDLYVDMFRWGSIKIRNASIAYFAEMVAVASSGYMSVCVAETGKGVPFVSAVEMRLLPDNLYTKADASSALIGFYGIDFGVRADLLTSSSIRLCRRRTQPPLPARPADHFHIRPRASNDFIHRPCASSPWPDSLRLREKQITSQAPPPSIEPFPLSQ